MSDQPFYAPNRTTAPRQPRAGEHLWAIQKDGRQLDCFRPTKPPFNATRNWWFEALPVGIDLLPPLRPGRLAHESMGSLDVVDNPRSAWMIARTTSSAISAGTNCFYLPFRSPSWHRSPSLVKQEQQDAPRKS